VRHALGLAERRRSFAIADVLGATRRQQRSLVLAEAVILITCGLAAGAATVRLARQSSLTVLVER